MRPWLFAPMVPVLAVCNLVRAQVSPVAIYNWSVAYGNLVTAPTATAAGVFNALAGATAIGADGATHARLRVSMNMPGVFGQNFPGPFPPPTIPAIGGGVGYFAGLFYTTFDLVAAEPNANGGALSPGWIRNGSLRPTSNPGLLPPVPGSVNGIGAVQLGQQPGLALPSVKLSTFTDFWEIFWTTSDLTPRLATFSMQVPAFASGSEAGATQLILNVHPDPLNEFTAGYARVTTNYAPVSVSVVPAPGAGAAMLLGVVVAVRRRRTLT